MIIKVYAHLSPEDMFEAGVRHGLSQEAADFFRCFEEVELELEVDSDNGLVLTCSSLTLSGKEKEVVDYTKKKYGVWQGDKEGKPFNPANCAQETSKNWIYFQCPNEPGHGKDGMFCEEHAERHPE